jgi:nitrite reductase/ring-hydroxylating ferredoxin subunit
MKKLITSIFITFTVLSCSTTGGGDNGNPNIRKVSFSRVINTNLPAFSSIQITGNTIFISNNNDGTGIKGVHIINTGAGFLAWEASCPNHLPNTCSTTLAKGITVTCQCEQYEYNLFTGQILSQSNQPLFNLVPYGVRKEGSNLVIFN